jgi:hypothetical protein
MIIFVKIAAREVAKSIGCPLDLDNDCVVRKAVKQRCRATGSPKTCPQSENPRFEVRFIAAFS